ncbi:hypothetical protein [Chryseobacterium rhizosphaerae]|uniref:Uncharacterized protein n=1 Tax=Chryseobacterium rhizosphaerae TaxID=395937 RepID=A0ABX9IIT3_9FLAO|nr:hypothetical protein [Chryseobacterium rhizosphaerae]MDR6547113.1 hypothetical protein [Chryseobacterium rhizosphaerae]REC73449.1 hypothetical protein DRF57_17225 [Chryseobacterium rhizosphaerae]GEN68659.1 hypothetical protein CRH01_32270 [Chryseobacterium rhizosphaerae]
MVEEKIEKFIDLLLEGYDVANKQEIISNCFFSYTNPAQYIADNEAEWVIESDEDGAFEFSVTNELFSFLIRGDKIDEVHELIDESLNNIIGDFPMGVKYVSDYFAWLQPRLDQENPPLEIIELADSYSDELQVMIVEKHNVENISKLCQELKVHFKRTTIPY